jgi:drug/metabolite transporter (DMT)-like permease
MPGRSQANAYTLLVVTMALWSSGLVAARAVHDDIGPMALTFWRWVSAVLILWPFVRRDLPAAWPRIRRDPSKLAVLVVSMGSGACLSVLALSFTTATNATVVNATQPAITALVAWALIGERLSGAQLFGVALAFLGILIMVSRADLASLLAFDVNVGDVLMLGAVVGWSCYAVYLHRGAGGLEGSVLLFSIACAATVGMLPLYVIEAASSDRLAFGGGALAAILYLGGGSTVLAVYLWNVAIRSVGANRAAVFVNLMPVFGSGLAMVFLGERLALYHVAGALLVFAGIVMAVRRRATALRGRELS